MVKLSVSMKKKQIISGLFLISGCIGSFLTWRWVRTTEYNKAVDRFEAASIFTSNKIFRINIINVNDADSANFIMASPTESLTKSTYGNYTELSLSFGPGSDAETSWHPIVRPDERELFLQKARIEIPGYSILELSENGEHVAQTPISDTVWPVLYQIPMNTNNIGLDLNSDKNSADAIQFMLNVQDNAVTNSFVNNDGSVIIKSLQPVFKEGIIIGCVSKEINVGETVSKVFGKARDLEHPGRNFDDEQVLLLLEHDDFKYRVYHISAIGEEFLLFDSDGLEISSTTNEPSKDFLKSENEVHEFDTGLDDITTTKFITKGTVKIANTHGLATLISLLVATVLISYTMYNWARLLSHRKKALDIAIIESEHKSKFVSEISHEFRTPLNGIMGMMDLIKTEETSIIVKKYMGIAESCSSMMLSLVNNILDFSKMETGNMTITRCSTSVRTIIEDVMDVMRVAYKTKEDEPSVMLRYEIDTSVPKGLSEIDDVRVRQVIVNLLSNALKFTKSGSVTLKASCESTCVKRGDTRLHISIIDTGIGMSAEGISRLFKPFSQVHNARQIKAGGTGLGLVICKKLCEAMGGSISCESVPGHGTTFSFDCVFGLPENQQYIGEGKMMEWDLSKQITVGDGEEEYIVEKASKPVYSKIGSCFTRRSSTSVRPSIICADDVNINRLLLDRMLNPLKIDVHFARDGAELVKYCSQRKFSLILTDMVMPIMNGDEASRIIATETGPNKDTPIIAITGSSDEEGMVVDRISKPVSRNLLYSKISKWITDEEITWIHDNMAIRE